MNTNQTNKIERLVNEYRRAMLGQVDVQKFTYYAVTYHSTAIEGNKEKRTTSLVDYFDIYAKNSW